MPTRDLAGADARRVALSTATVDYVLVRRRGRRGIGLRVDGSGLTVSAPLTMPLAAVEALIRESEAWVLRKLRDWSTRRVPEIRWETGARLPFLGGGLALRLIPHGRPGAERQGDELWVRTRNGTPEEIRRVVVAWYKRTAATLLAERVRILATAARLAPPRFVLSSAMGRWGSCNSRREVRLTWRLAKAPLELIDYVACHELAHLRHMNHSPAFWAEVERQCPDYRRLRDRLHAIDHEYRSF